MYANFGSAGHYNFTGDTQEVVADGATFDTDNRELNSGQGRWLSPDPAQAGWNPYAYSTNPNSSVDPSGLAMLRIGREAGTPFSGDSAMADEALGGLDWKPIWDTVPANQQQGNPQSQGDWIAQTINRFNAAVAGVFRPEFQTLNLAFLNWDYFQQFGMANTTVTVGEYHNTILNPFNHIAIGVGNTPTVGLNPASESEFAAVLAVQSFACLMVLCNPLEGTLVPGIVSPEDPRTPYL